jgi:hypothetical protein
MGLRYKIPFKDSENTEYLVQIFREGYNGEAKELTGAVSCFVVSGTDDDFVYTPIRPSSATIKVLDSDLLLDLYSINNQYAPVRFLRNGVLEWTGFIRPEQFTQPYVPTAEVISVDCVCALSTLEKIEYKQINNLTGVVDLWTLIKTLISYAKGSYRGVCIPWVYGSSSSMTGNVFERITLIENNFIKEEMTLYEVLEAVCKFLNWTVYDFKGCLWFVDNDWTGTYRMYDEALETFAEIQGNEILLQDVGFNGSDSNTLDVVPGYNKASVKALNNVFDDVVKDEDYDSLETYANGGYLTKTYSSGDGSKAVRKQFLKPKSWAVYAYKNGLLGTLYNQDELNSMGVIQLNGVLGALLMKEAEYKCLSLDNYSPTDEVTDFNYENSVQVRVDYTSSASLNTMGLLPAVVMEGENAVYSDCAFSIDCRIDVYYDDDMTKPSKDYGSKLLNVCVQCGDRYYNGLSWVNEYSTFSIELDDNGEIKSNRTPFTPYKSISGYVIPMDFFVGKPIITVFCPVLSTYMTGSKIRNLKFGYAKKEGVVEEGENGDRVYENIVNEAYMSDAEEITFEISSYNRDGASFSKALLDNGWLTNNLFCAVVGEMVRPEELMIRRIVNRYGETKIKLTEAICMTEEISPITRVKERSMAEKTFRLTSGEWDYEQNKLTLQIQEDV